MPDPGPKEPKGLSEIGDYASRDVKTIAAHASLREAGRLMAQHGIGSLLVVREGPPVGIITDTDLARKGAALGLSPDTATVQDLMSSPVVSIEAHRSVEEAQAFMKSRGIRHLAVTEEGQVVGVVTLSDIVRYYARFFTTTE